MFQSIENPIFSLFNGKALKKVKEFFSKEGISKELVKGDLEQALNLYHEVKRILNVDAELKNYRPR